jgi:hypothetical protein
VALLDLIGRGADGMRQAGEDALRSASTLVHLDDVTLMAPIPRPPSIRDSLCFWTTYGHCPTAYGWSNAGLVVGDGASLLETPCSTWR